MIIRYYFHLVILSLLASSCSQSPNETKEVNNIDEKQLELTTLSDEDKTFSDVHYVIATEAIAALKNKDYVMLESYAVKEFLPSKGFESLDFIVTIADFIADKELPSKESVKLEVGLNNYKGKKISFKSYEFPFYIMENADTTGRAAVVVTFSDRIEENKIANFSFRDY
ncbi:hypothetical protein N8223_00675 [Bacteroidia bacterium]|jgi:hypothetical protein|nr:hypothetical protein [Bacteroidia bacterium]|tara:strand:- start:2875 stop:3381 length:507 start_codon:yes stop_codon:yes gene_type:complete